MAINSSKLPPDALKVLASATKARSEMLAKKAPVSSAPSPSRPIPGQPGYAGTTGGPKPAPSAIPNKPNPMANATGPMVPVRGGGMAPASVANLMKKGGKVKSKSSYSSGGGVKSSASKRGDGCAQRGKTKGRIV